MREDISRAALQRRIAQLSRRLHAAGFTAAGVYVGGSRPGTPVSEADSQLRLPHAWGHHRGSLNASSLHAAAAAAAAVSSPECAGAAYDELKQQLSEVQADTAAMLALLQQLCEIRQSQEAS